MKKSQIIPEELEDYETFEEYLDELKAEKLANTIPINKRLKITRKIFK